MVTMTVTIYKSHSATAPLPSAGDSYKISIKYYNYRPGEQYTYN